MKIQESAENYLERILILQEEQGQVRSIDIATSMQFTKPSVSNAMKRLREGGYIEVDGDGFIHLTKSGLAIAEKIYERHRVISQILINLGVSEETALADACRMEHAISEESFACMKRHYEEHFKK